MIAREQSTKNLLVMIAIRDVDSQISLIWVSRWSQLNDLT